MTDESQIANWFFRGLLFLLGAVQALGFFILNGMRKRTDTHDQKIDDVNSRITGQAAYNAETFARRDDMSTMKNEILGAIDSLRDDIRGKR